jgi:hypothetical protein
VFKPTSSETNLLDLIESVLIEFGYEQVEQSRIRVLVRPFITCS